MTRDPVCNVDVDETSAWYSEHHGNKYYFSSAECKASFDRNPAGYVSSEEHTGGGEAVSSKARSKIKSMISDKKEKAAERAGTVSSALRSVAERMREQNQEKIGEYAEKAAAGIERFSHYVQEKDADQIIHEAENFVRRRPALVIGSAFAAGFFLARFLRSSRAVST